MDSFESDGQNETKTARVRYTRAEILEAKKNPISSAEFENEFSRINASILRSTRGRSRLNSFSKSQTTEKTRDTSNIVLGPQKRTWNTGCHVSQQTPGREITDTGSSVRWPKFAVEHRSSEKLNSKAVGDYKRDYRCNDSRGHGHSGRGRGSARQLEGASYIRNNKEDRFVREYRTSNSHSEDEPEWFLEGPATVNETIELGGILEESLDCENNFVAKTVDKSDYQPGEVDGDKPEKIKDIVADKLEIESSEAKPTTSPEQASKVPIGGLDHNENGNRGSRFKHLFQKNEQPDENIRPNSNYSHNTSPLNNLNEQLLNLLKVKPPGLSNIEKNRALQAENKLRSILFGNTSIPSSNAEQRKNDSSESKHKVYTVEEIEAEMTSDISRPTDKTVGSLPQIPDPLMINDQAIKYRGNPIGFSKNYGHTPQTESTASWVPLLRSLAEQNQKAVNSQPMDMHSSLSHFGLLPGSMANAVSASARINQLQHPDIPLNSTADVNSTSQGFLYQLWNGTRDPPANARPQFHSPVLYPGMSRLRSPNAFPTVPPGRPIVKSQQNVFSSHNSGQTNNPISGNDQNSMLINSSIQQEANRQFFNMGLRQYRLNSIETDLLNNSSASLSGHRQDYGNSFPLHTPTTTLTSSIPFNPHLQQQAKTNNSLTNNGSLNLLSQLMELDRLKQQPPGIDSNFSGIKAKTLEEIEQLESPKNNILF